MLDQILHPGPVDGLALYREEQHTGPGSKFVVDNIRSRPRRNHEYDLRTNKEVYAYLTTERISERA